MGDGLIYIYSVCLYNVLYSSELVSCESCERKTALCRQVLVLISFLSCELASIKNAIVNLLIYEC